MKADLLRPVVLTLRKSKRLLKPLFGKLSKPDGHRALSFLAVIAILLSLASSLILPIPVLAATAPSVEALDATSITIDTATLNGNVTSTGGENPHVWILWKETGQQLSLAGTNPERHNDVYEYRDYWEHVVDMGYLGAGEFSLNVTDLQNGYSWASGLGCGQITYRILAINSAGEDVSDDEHFYTTMPSADGDSWGGTSNYDFKHGGGYAPMAQTFNVTTGFTLYAVSVYMDSGTGAVETLRLKAVDGAGKPTPYSGTPLATATCNRVSSTVTYLFFFDTPIALNSSTQYALEFQETSSTYYGYLPGRATTDLYAGGTLWRKDGSSYHLMQDDLGFDCDIFFALYDSNALRKPLLETNYLLDSEMTETTATLRGTVYQPWDYSCNVSFQYGLNASYGSETSTTLVATHDTSDGVLVTKDISGLTAATTYHYRAKAVNTYGTGYGADAVFTTPDYSEEGATITEGLGQNKVLIASQRKSFYAQGRYWVFYEAANNYLSFKSSTDGITWSDATIANDLFLCPSDSQITVVFDGTHVHFATGRVDHELGYKMGTPNADGTITWSSAGLQEAIGIAEVGKLYTAPYITVDSEGYPWVLVGTCDPGFYLTVEVYRSTTNNGTWTTASGYPKNLSWGSYWQRGIELALPDGDMYFIAGRRCMGGGGFDYNGYEPLKGARYYAGTDTYTSPASITATAMDYIGDVDTDPYALFSAVSWASGDTNAVYLVFTNAYNQLQFLTYDADTNTWTGETTLASGLARRTAPVLTVHDSDGKLFCFWLGADNHIYCKSKTQAGSWDAVATDLAFENVLDDVANINTWEHSVEGKAFLMYRTCATSQVTYLHGSQAEAGTTFGIKGIIVDTGFGVATDTPSSITGYTATLNGHVANDGGEACSVRFQYGTTTAYGTNTSWQTGKYTSDPFSQPISGLLPTSTYHVRSEAKHADETTVYGADIEFDTETVGAPTVDKDDASSITCATAILNGEITDTGGLDATLRGFVWGTSPSTFPNYPYCWNETGTYGAETFDHSIGSLEHNTTYYYRAYAINDIGTGYSSEGTFDTTACEPTVVINTASGITGDSAQLNAIISDNGGVTVTTRGFMWGTSTGVYPYSWNETGSFPIGAFDHDISGLIEDMAYYYMAYAVNEAGTGESTEGTFTVGKDIEGLVLREVLPIAIIAGIVVGVILAVITGAYMAIVYIIVVGGVLFVLVLIMGQVFSTVL